MSKLSDFEKKLKEGYWLRGNIWEFDWYIDVFFIKAMSYGKYPLKLGYMEAVLGDEFLDFKYSTLIKKEYESFLLDKIATKKLVKDQNEIIDSAKKLINKLENSQFSPETYKEVQLNLSLLMASVSVVFDELMPNIISEITNGQNATEEEVVAYIVDSSNKTALNESNKKLVNLFSKYEMDINKAKFKYAKLPRELQKVIKKHADAYGWINTGEKGAHDWTACDFLVQMKTLIEKGWQENTTSKPKISSKSSWEIVNNLIQINVNDNNAADLQVRLDWLFQKYLKTRLGENYTESILENLTYEEIVSIIERQSEISDFADRRNNYRVAWPQDGKVNFHYFRDKGQFKKLVKKVASVNEKGSLSGTVACKGTAVGQVRIVKKQSDLKSFQEGEVLVATKTQPKYVMVMTKAAAIVTEVGGITSHAAIVSREFNIPCIVGVKNATKSLKNGDKIIVDAENGEVRLSQMF